MLEVWEREQTFAQLREKNRGGPRWSFIDGPVTANKKLAIHTAWGRTLKDVLQRFHGLRGAVRESLGSPTRQPGSMD